MKFVLFVLLLSSPLGTALTKESTPTHFDTKSPKIVQMLKQRGVKKTINYSLKKDCLEGNELSCAVLNYRHNQTYVNIKNVTNILKQYPCTLKKLNNCTHHLFARIYMEKHELAKKLAKKLCRLDHYASCRQLRHYRTLRK